MHWASGRALDNKLARVNVKWLAKLAHDGEDRAARMAPSVKGVVRTIFGEPKLAGVVTGDPGAFGKLPRRDQRLHREEVALLADELIAEPFHFLDGARHRESTRVHRCRPASRR